MVVQVHVGDAGSREESTPRDEIRVDPFEVVVHSERVPRPNEVRLPERAGTLDPVRGDTVGRETDTARAARRTLQGERIDAGECESRIDTGHAVEGAAVFSVGRHKPELRRGANVLQDTHDVEEGMPTAAQQRRALVILRAEVGDRRCSRPYL